MTEQSIIERLRKLKGEFDRKHLPIDAADHIEAQAKRIEDAAKKLEQVLADEESGEGWGPDVTTVGLIREALSALTGETQEPRGA